MVTLVVARPTVVPAAQQPPPGPAHPKMTIVAEGGVVFTVPFAPNDVSLGNVGVEWQQVVRPGRAPLLLRSGTSLETMTFSLIVGFRDPQQSVEPQLSALRALMRGGQRMVVNLDASATSHRWRLTSFTQRVMARQRGTNAPTRAECAFVFTEVSDPVVAVGPVSGGAVSGPAATAAGPAKLPTTYVWKNKDTLASVSKQFYGDTKFGNLILDENKIRRGGSVIAGQKLRIPKKK